MAKIRNGFVSNSSSSSFIVKFDKPELDVEYIKHTIYNDNDCVSDYFNVCTSYWDTMRLSAYIVNTLTRVKERKDLLESLEGLNWYDDNRFPEIPRFKNSDTREQQQEKWDQYDKKKQRMVNLIADNILKNISESEYLYVGEFADDTSMGAHLEHGGDLDAVLIKRINNH